jgi:hypothetical protein
MNLLVQLFTNYLESHPQQVEQLVAALVDALIAHLNKPAAPKA